MNKNDLYPNLIAEPIAKSKKNKILLLFNSENSMGYKIKGDVSDICVKFDGKTTLSELVQEYKKVHTEPDYDIDAEVEKMLQILESHNLIEYLKTPLP